MNSEMTFQEAIDFAMDKSIKTGHTPIEAYIFAMGLFGMEVLS